MRQQRVRTEITDEHHKAISRYLKKPVGTVVALAKRLGLERTTVQGIIGRKRARTCKHKHRLSQKDVENSYKTVRATKAATGCYRKVTAKEASAQAVAASRKRSRKFKSPTRMNSGLKDRALRDPRLDKDNGELAVNSSQLDYYRNHRR